MSGGAAVLAEIFGTEKDKVNCAFYFKIGACRHGDRCTRLHHKPTFSQTILMRNMYQSPYTGVVNNEFDREGNMLVDVQSQEHFDKFYEDLYCEMERKFGEIEELNVCGNFGDHLVGNVYVKFRSEYAADAAAKDLDKRWYNGLPVYAELSPVTDFRESCCRQYDAGECNRGGFCNFMHLKPISRELKRRLDDRFRYSSRNRSPPIRRRRSRSRSPSFSSRNDRRSRNRDDYYR